MLTLPKKLECANFMDFIMRIYVPRWVRFIFSAFYLQVNVRSFVLEESLVRIWGST